MNDDAEYWERWKQHKTCTSKVGYQSRGEANLRKRSISRNGKGDGALKPYRCGYCGLWHLGHTRSKGEKANARRGD